MAESSAATRVGVAPLPGEFSQLVESFRFQLLSYLRANRFLGMLLLTLAVTALLVGFSVSQGAARVRSDNSGDPGSFLQGELAFVAILVVLSASFFGGDALSIDFGSPAGYFTLVLPVRRSILLLGRYLAAFAATLSLLVLQYVVIGAAGFAIFGSLPGLFAESFLLAALDALAILSVAFALGAFFRKPVVSLVATILVMIFVLPISVFAVEQIRVEPFFLVSYADPAITNVFAPPPHLISVVTPTATFTSYNATIPEAAAILAVYAIAGLLLSLLINQRREVTG